MITVLQRVNKAKVIIENKLYSEINSGYLIFLGIFKEDSENDANKLVEKIINLRIMSDDQGKMNKSITEIGSEIMVVSQFTLCANLKGGRRPDFFPAMQPKEAEKLYNIFIKKLKTKNVRVKSGHFAAHMKIELTNDGPVTFILDSKNL